MKKPSEMINKQNEPLSPMERQEYKQMILSRDIKQQDDIVKKNVLNMNEQEIRQMEIDIRDTRAAFPNPNMWVDFTLRSLEAQVKIRKKELGID